MIKVEVTKEDIRRGLPGSPWSCPVAIAVTRCLGVDAGLVEVYPDSAIGVDDRGYCEYEATYKMPAKVREFVGRFDEGKPVKPFIFYLRRTKGGEG